MIVDGSPDPVGPRDRALRTTPGGAYPAKSPLHALAFLQEHSFKTTKNHFCDPMVNGFVFSSLPWDSW
ncbi:hypothetical protein PVAP13_8KG097104 [Panicum virgatum]|uniref:Uncharacterized protein n=1 Tax=Panicum virgatum TaxID=38727 RepID=A0A8T0PMH0_PANVG|nr:hypothetical protein PVAP13_8KG097104 [Panicum virgatum]